jgi:hypothetical protein
MVMIVLGLKKNIYIYIYLFGYKKILKRKKINFLYYFV